MKGYDDFLSDILNEHGLEHGYDMFAEGKRAGHRIFRKESMKKNSMMQRMMPGGMPEQYTVDDVAEFLEEPSFDIQEGGYVSLEVLDMAYERQLDDVMEQIAQYTRERRANPSVKEREREPYILRTL